MPTSYAQKQSAAQKKESASAASVFDSSSQNKSLQRKADMANNATQRTETPRPNNTGMPDNLKSGIENLSGFSMDDVRVHYNSSKPATVQALAYTQGTDIHVAPGQEKHLPHEAWHVAQQMAGRVSPTTNINGMPVNDNAGLEHEADVMGAKAVQMKSDERKTTQRSAIWNGVVQRAIDLNAYYYHLSPDGIPKDKGIDPMYYLNDTRIKGATELCKKYGVENSGELCRFIRGDDLGPGFYMGDFDTLKHYYNKNKRLPVFIYYIKKEEIESQNTTDFTEENTQGIHPYDLFQIAMQLGFRYADENDVNNFQRPLDLLASEKTRFEDTGFEDCVKKIYGDDYAPKIIDFFKNAKGKAIWKGYFNDIENQILEIKSLESIDIIEFFKKNGKVEDEKLRSLATELAKIFNDNFNDSTRNYDTIIEESQKKLEDNLLFDYWEKYYVFLIRKFNYYKYNFVGNPAGPKPPIQIVIRSKDVTSKDNKRLLEEIIEKKIEITNKDLTTEGSSPDTLEYHIKKAIVDIYKANP